MGPVDTGANTTPLPTDNVKNKMTFQFGHKKSDSNAGPQVPSSQGKSPLISAHPSVTVPIQTGDLQGNDQPLSTANISASSSVSRLTALKNQAHGQEISPSVSVCTIAGCPGRPSIYIHTCHVCKAFVHPVCQMRILSYTPEDSDSHLCSKCFGNNHHTSNSTDQCSIPTIPTLPNRDTSQLHPTPEQPSSVPAQPSSTPKVPYSSQEMEVPSQLTLLARELRIEHMLKTFNQTEDQAP